MDQYFAQQGVYLNTGIAYSILGLLALYLIWKSGALKALRRIKIRDFEATFDAQDDDQPKIS